jgi:hypothetical protein
MASAPSSSAGKRMHFEPGPARRDGDDWIVTLTSTGNGYNGTSDIRFTLDGDRISRLIIAP